MPVYHKPFTLNNGRGAGGRRISLAQGLSTSHRVKHLIIATVILVRNYKGVQECALHIMQLGEK